MRIGGATYMFRWLDHDKLFNVRAYFSSFLTANVNNMDIKTLCKEKLEPLLKLLWKCR